MDTGNNVLPGVHVLHFSRKIPSKFQCIANIGTTDDGDHIDNLPNIDLRLGKNLVAQMCLRVSFYKDITKPTNIGHTGSA